jgi:hypothetical protein
MIGFISDVIIIKKLFQLNHLILLEVANDSLEDKGEQVLFYRTYIEADVSYTLKRRCSYAGLD